VFLLAVSRGVREDLGFLEQLGGIGDEGGWLGGHTELERLDVGVVQTHADHLLAKQVVSLLDDRLASSEDLFLHHVVEDVLSGLLIVADVQGSIDRVAQIDASDLISPREICAAKYANVGETRVLAEDQGVRDLSAVPRVGHPVAQPAGVAHSQRPESPVKASGQQHGTRIYKEVMERHLREAVVLVHVLRGGLVQNLHLLAVDEELSLDVLLGIVGASDDGVWLVG